jgi:hypothetical protein
LGATLGGMKRHTCFLSEGFPQSRIYPPQRAIDSMGLATPPRPFHQQLVVETSQCGI